VPALCYTYQSCAFHRFLCIDPPVLPFLCATDGILALKLVLLGSECRAMGNSAWWCLPRARTAPVDTQDTQLVCRVKYEDVFTAGEKSQRY
jgi:hypothetical protein